jgi:hypothetical protein
MGMGFGRGGGRGWRNRFWATGMTGWQRAAMGPAAAPAPESEVEALRGQAEHFERALEGIRRRIDEIEGKSGQ